MSRIEFLGQVRWEGESWQPSGRFDHDPTVQELREKAWNVIGMRTKGSPYPVEVRAVTVTYEPSPPYPFEEGGP